VGGSCEEVPRADLVAADPRSGALRPCKLGLRTDRDGPYLLLAGIRAVFVTAATLAYAAHFPLPRGGT
jgi:hypothetical protein